MRTITSGLLLISAAFLSLAPQLFANKAIPLRIDGERCAGRAFKLTSIPETLKGYSCYPLERGDKSEPGRGATVQLSAPTVVYLAVMDRGAPKLGKGWKKTNMTLGWFGDHVPFTDLIYKKIAKSGALDVPEHIGKTKNNYGVPNLLIVPSSVQVTADAAKGKGKEASADKQDRPNVVFILSDDQAWGDYGFMGHPKVKTPNLDRLAGEGLLYERGYDTASMCRPSLASIVTGLYPHQTAVRGNHSIPAKYVEAFKTMSKTEGRTLTRKHSHLMTASLKNAPSMAKQLQANGYATLQTGKWWEGDPLDHGFDEKCGHQIGRKTMQPIHRFVEDAQKKKKPFFIWYAVFLPHTPHNAPDRLYNSYKEIAPNESTARYWANIAWLDETCGQLVDYLKKKNLYDNTLFVYASDNGWLPDPNEVGGYIRSKKEAVEVGVRTPIFVTHKKGILPNRDKETLASTIDIAPTILRACGIEPDKAMSGLDLRKPEQLAKRGRIFVDIYDRDVNIDAVQDVHSDILARVVVDDWDKLIARPNSYELYDLKNDPDDRNDISDQHPEKVRELSALINTWLEETPIVFGKKR